MARILVLDDSLARHEVFKKRLAGHDVTHVTTANDAIQALNTQPRYDMAFLDHSLGEAEGPLNPGVAERDLPTGMRVVDHLCQMAPSARPPAAIIHSHDYHPAREMYARLSQVGMDTQIQPFTV